MTELVTSYPVVTTPNSSTPSVDHQPREARWLVRGAVNRCGWAAEGQTPEIVKVRICFTNSTKTPQQWKQGQVVVMWTVVRYKYLVYQDKRSVVSGRKQCVELRVVKCVGIKQSKAKNDNKR